nr:hypothetical protein [Tanacetum cinerariifolium]
MATTLDQQTTQQYGVLLPIELTTDDIRDSKAYKEYYAYATGEAAPKPKASARKKKGDVERTEAKQLKIVLKRSRQEMHISQQHSSGTDEGTGSRPGVLDVPSDDSEEEFSWNSSDDEDDDAEKVNDDDDNEEEVPKIDEQEVTESNEGDDEATESDRECEDEETREQEERVLIQFLEPLKTMKMMIIMSRIKGRGLQVSQETEDSHVILTLTLSDAQQESSSTSSFMTNLLNPITDPDRVKSLEDNFSNIPGIVNQYMHQQMPEAVREVVQTQKNRLQDSIQRENDEFLKTMDENMKKVIKEQVKTQVKAQVTRILPRIEEAVNAQLEAGVLTRSSHSSRTSYAVAADLSEMELKKILIDKMEGN